MPTFIHSQLPAPGPGALPGRRPDAPAVNPQTVRSARSLVEAALAVVQTLTVADALALHGDGAVLFVDLREAAELQREGGIPGALHTPRGVLEFRVDPASEWHLPVFSRPGTRLLLFCALGWRSALAARALQDMGIADVAHIGGGFRAWQAAGAPVSPPAVHHETGNE